MKIKLIAPHEQSETTISSAETFKFQRINLPLLAALCPPGHEVKIVDETFGPDTMDEEVDLVGITVITDLALRAYHIAKLYRQRGDALFEKNVRLSLIGTKKARDRLVHPLNNTFDEICNGLSPNIFPFYHVGITISASSATKDSNGELILERPNIINGCQTITIANDFYSKLQKGRAPEKIELFKQIREIGRAHV
jgi:hypothetical protein